MKPGYKQTEVGIIPEDWNVVTATEACSLVVDCKNRTPPFVADSDYAVVRTPNVREGQFVLDDLRFTDEAAYREWTARAVPRLGDIMITREAPLGEVCAVPKGRKVCLGQRMMLYRPDLKKTDSSYLLYALMSRPVKAHLLAKIGGSTVGHAKVDDIRLLQLPLPPLPEQHAIAEALSDVDKLLDGLDRLIAKNRDFKQAAMQQLLTGQTRLPGFRGEWVISILGMIADISKGVQLHSSETHPEGHFPHFNGGISPSGYTNKFNTVANTITISEGGNSCGYVQMVSHPFWCGGHCYAIVPRGSCNRFLFHALKGQQSAIMGLRVGSGLPNVQKTALQNFHLRIPVEKAEQTAIAEILSDMDAELAALERRREKTRVLKQAMMQELLTGRIRLVSLEPQLVAVDSSPAVPVVEAASEKAHNWAINEAVVVAVLVKNFGDGKFPLGRKRCTKLAYLLHRHAEHVAQGYLKKAAGPYNPAVKYRGPESIAQKNGYIRPHKNGTYSGYVAADNIAQAESYFAKWYGLDVLKWLAQFRFKSNDELELLATVDMAIEDLKRENTPVDLQAVKSLIGSHPEWEAKLERPIFSDSHIVGAMARAGALFPVQD